MVNPQDQWRLQESEKRGGEGRGGQGRGGDDKKSSMNLTRVVSIGLGVTDA